MVYRKATYEEYVRATSFAKLRYRYGVYIQFVAAFLLLLLLYYAVTNVEEMKAHPAEYAEKKLGVICERPIVEQQYIIDYGNIGNFSNITEG